jgi:hypothetical protein
MRALRWARILILLMPHRSCPDPLNPLKLQFLRLTHIFLEDRSPLYFTGYLATMVY